MTRAAPVAALTLVHVPFAGAVLLQRPCAGAALLVLLGALALLGAALLPARAPC